MKNHFKTFIFVFTILLVKNIYSQDSSIVTGINPFSQSKFVPDISLILDASYNYKNLLDDEYKELTTPGFMHHHSEGDLHVHNSFVNGFNFNYGELYISSIVDPYFDLTGIFHLSRHGFEIEEGYFITRSLPLGLQLKGGKFYSSFGKMNEQHPHVWDFSDNPLIYKSFFGNEGLNEVGLQLNWIAPTAFYLNFGTEILQGENENSFGTEGFSNDIAQVKSSNGPNLINSFIKTSFDFDNLINLLNLSFATGKNRIYHQSDDVSWHALYGNTNIYALGLTLKYLIDPIKYISFQSEILYRKISGTKYEKDSLTILANPYENLQSGMYSHLIYKFSQRWRLGLRLDLLQTNNISVNSNKIELPKNLPRYSAMIDFNPTEFSRIRLQYNYDKTKYKVVNTDYDNKIIHQVLLQINLSIGAHGAHNF